MRLHHLTFYGPQNAYTIGILHEIRKNQHENTPIQPSEEKLDS